jgi:hypothetical protein
MNYLKELIERLSKALRPKTVSPQKSSVISESHVNDTLAEPAPTAAGVASVPPSVAGE